MPLNRSHGDRLNRVLAGMLLLGEPAAVDTTSGGLGLRADQGSGGHGKHGATTAPPPRTNPLVLQWAERFDALLTAAERDLEDAKRLTREGQWTTDAYGRTFRDWPAIKRRIRSRDYEGRDAVWVAFVERCSVSLVEKTRGNAGLDPATGERREKGLTSREVPNAA